MTEYYFRQQKVLQKFKNKRFNEHFITALAQSKGDRFSWKLQSIAYGLILNAQGKWGSLNG